MEKAQQKNEASIDAINKNQKKEPKPILTEQEKEFVKLLSDIIIRNIFRKGNVIIKNK